MDWSSLKYAAESQKSLERRAWIRFRMGALTEIQVGAWSEWTLSDADWLNREVWVHDTEVFKPLIIFIGF